MLLFKNFIDFWLHWVFVAVPRLSLVVVSGSYSSLRCLGFSLLWLLLLQSTGSRRIVSSICGAWVKLPFHIWDLPGPGIKPMSPALAGRFLTTGPPGKSRLILINYNCVCVCLAARSCLNLCDLMNSSQPDSSVHGDPISYLIFLCQPLF